MADLEDRLRETLRRRAVAVPPALEVPAGLLHRARLRIARNVSAVALAIVIVALGAVSGVRALGGPSVHQPATSPRPAPGCQAANLSGSSNLMASNAETREGFLTITNVGAACSLQDRPIVRVLKPNGMVEPLSDGDLAPYWQVNGTGAPPDWPVVTLQPGDKAKIRVQWKSWCGGSRDTDPTTWEIQLPGRGGKVTFAVTRQDVPTCPPTGQHSTLKVGPFEPYSA